METLYTNISVKNHKNLPLIVKAQKEEEEGKIPRGTKEERLIFVVDSDDQSTVSISSICA